MVRRALPLLAALAVLAAAGQANASWSGYWTYVRNPPPPKWVWTWVWTAPPGGFKISAATLSRIGLAATSAPDCCGITITGFGALGAKGIERTGLLLTDFTLSSDPTTANSIDLVLVYTGIGPLAPGEDLGTLSVVDPSSNPDNAPLPALGYTESFVDSAGAPLTQSGVIAGVPEPGLWAMMLVGFGGLGVALRTRRQALA